MWKETKEMSGRWSEREVYAKKGGQRGTKAISTILRTQDEQIHPAASKVILGRWLTV